MHLEIVEMYRRIQGRVPLPWFELSTETVARHNAEARPLLRFEEIPIELTDLRLLVRQTADILKRHDALEEGDRQKVESLGRDMKLLAVAAQWYRSAAERHVTAGVGGVAGHPPPDRELPDSTVIDQVLTIAMR